MSLNHVLFTGIVSSAVIVLTAITLDFRGVVDLGCNTDGCNVRLEKVSSQTKLVNNSDSL